MDPDKCLAELIEAAWKFEESNRAGHFNPALEEARKLSEGFRALNDWLTKGGYKPRRWLPGDVLDVKRPK